LLNFFRFLSPRPAKTARKILTVKRRGLTQGSAFWGSHRFQKLPKGSFFPNHPKFGLGTGISSLNKSINTFATVHAIFAQISSIGAAWQKTF
jgi:hypothetical protein